MITHKRGDSFDHLAKIPVKVTLPDGTTTGFEDGFFVGWTVTAQIRTAQYDRLLAELTCSWADPAATTRILSVKALHTSTWTLGPAEMDIQFYNPTTGYTISTNTISIEVVKDITRPDGGA